MHILRAKGTSETSEWLEKLKAAQKAHQEKTQIFKSLPLPATIAIGNSDAKVTCGDTFEGGYIVGTDAAVYACLENGWLFFFF